MVPYILACHLQIDAESYSAYHFDADPDSTFQFDADPGSGSTVVINSTIRATIKFTFESGTGPPTAMATPLGPTGGCPGSSASRTRLSSTGGCPRKQPSHCQMLFPTTKLKKYLLRKITSILHIDNLLHFTESSVLCNSRKNVVRSTVTF
jgi:hypothetical protein